MILGSNKEARLRCLANLNLSETQETRLKGSIEVAKFRGPFCLGNMSRREVSLSGYF